MAQFLEPDQLAALLRGPDKDSVLVVDVRDDDFYGGHIKGAVNIESDLIRGAASIDTIIDRHMQPPVARVVVHCMFSQQRGPRCANAIFRRLQERAEDGAPDLAPAPAPAVFVLRGGFTQFVARYRDEPDLVEDIDPNNWDNS